MSGTRRTGTPVPGLLPRLPVLVFAAPRDIHGLNLDIESRAPVGALPEENIRYLEPETLSHSDFLGVCTARAMIIS